MNKFSEVEEIWQRTYNDIKFLFRKYKIKAKALKVSMYEFIETIGGLYGKILHSSKNLKVPLMEERLVKDILRKTFDGISFKEKEPFLTLLKWLGSTLEYLYNTLDSKKELEKDIEVYKKKLDSYEEKINSNDSDGDVDELEKDEQWELEKKKLNLPEGLRKEDCIFGVVESELYEEFSFL